MRGVVQVASNAQIDAAEKADAEARAAAVALTDDQTTSALAGFIRTQYEVFRNHRNQSQSGWSERLLSALRAFNGQYDATRLNEIKQFGGSEVYARIIAMKCRGASSLLRDVYLAPERPWAIKAGPDPEIPEHIQQSIKELIRVELSTMQQAGQPADPEAIRDRTQQLFEAARQAAKKNAVKQAQLAEDKIEELLLDGDFYKALAEFLVDLPLFPFACIKGPVVRIVPSVSWRGGQATVTSKPRLFWQRISPFDLYWTPGASDIEDAAVIERTRVTRADLNDLLDLPGYNQDALRAVLDEYGRGGISDDWDSGDSERAVHESRENPNFNQSGLIACLEYHGNVQGRWLLEAGVDPKIVPDALRDYMVQAWLIGRHVIKVQLSPSPRKRHPYFITSFEKVPGTPVGNGLPDLLHDVQEVCNASLRTLVNNLSIASGPQVVVNDDRLAADEDGEQMYPWKRWHVRSDPMGNNSQVPISFFQPNSNAQELLAVYQKFNDIADDISAIPRYLSGQSSGGAGRTASGLAMLMSNASKILQTVAANVDRDVMYGLFKSLFDMILLTDTTGILTGEEQVRIMGVNVAIQRETQRARQLEFLQITANPVDSQIVGPKGRASILRSVAQTIGLDGAQIVPTEDELVQQEMQQKQMQAAQQLQTMAEAGAQAQGGQKPPSSNGDTGPRTNIHQQAPVAGGPQ